MTMDSIALSIFASRIAAVCDEMGAVLRRSAFSPNIKDRLDYSCALFDRYGGLCAQAAHIPVHLGSMAFAMADLVNLRRWNAGDLLVLNDPLMGGTHLPDVTVVAPAFVDEFLIGFVANRAHHANIGASQPGSMPVARRLEDEGRIIPPTLLIECGHWDEDVFEKVCGRSQDVRIRGDFQAQVSACRLGVQRLEEVARRQGLASYLDNLMALNDYAEKLAHGEWRDLPDGNYSFTDFMDDDGLGTNTVPVAVSITITSGNIEVDFRGTAAQVDGNINCPLSVAAAAVFYCFRCLLPAYAPACAGTFRPIKIHAPKACLVNAEHPAAVAAGNVETSSRIVDAVFGALAEALPQKIPAASQGTMNNLAMGSVATADTPAWDYYETMAGGHGAGPGGPGMSARQSHMTNTLNTPLEVLESQYPVRVLRYQVRRDSGGTGTFAGGNGVVREFEFLKSAQVSLLSERRTRAPWGLHGGTSGKKGCNSLNGDPVPGKVNFEVRPGDRLCIATPGGGGWNKPGDSR